MDDEDGRCLLDVICDPQALNDFLHGSETQLDTDDLLDGSSDPSSSFFTGAGGHVPEVQTQAQLSASESSGLPRVSVDLDFLEDVDILGGLPGGGGGDGGSNGVGSNHEPCDILQQSLAEANITEQSLQEAEAELDLSSFGLTGLTQVVQPLPDAGLPGVGIGGTAQIFPGQGTTTTPSGAATDMLGSVLAHPGLQLQSQVMNKAISVQPFMQQVGLGNVTISSLQTLPNGSQSGHLGIGQIQVVGQPTVMTINPSGQQLLTKTMGGYQLHQPGPDAASGGAQTGLGGSVLSSGGGLLIQGGKATLGSPSLNGPAVCVSSTNTNSGTTMAAPSGIVGFSGAPLSTGIGSQTQPQPQSQIMQNVIIQRTPTPIQPKPPQGGAIQTKLFKQQPQPLPVPHALQNDASKALGVQQVPASAAQNVAFLTGKPGSNVVLSTQTTTQGAPFPQALFKQQGTPTSGKPLSVHLLNQQGSIVIPSQAVLQGQNHQFLLPQLQTGGQILTQHPAGHIITSSGPGGQIIAANQILTANQNINLGQVLASQGHPGAAHILSGPIQLQPGQIGQPTLFQMPVSLAQTQTQAHPVTGHVQTVIQGMPIQNSLAIESLSPAVSLQPALQQQAGGIPSSAGAAVMTQCQPGESITVLGSSSEPSTQPQPQPSILTVQTGPTVSAPVSVPSSTPPSSAAATSSVTAVGLGSQMQHSPGKVLFTPPGPSVILSQESVQMFLQQEQQHHAGKGPPVSVGVPAAVIVSGAGSGPAPTGLDIPLAEPRPGRSPSPSLGPAHMGPFINQVPSAAHQQALKVQSSSPSQTVATHSATPSLSDSPQASRASPLTPVQIQSPRPAPQSRPPSQPQNQPPQSQTPSRSCTPSSLPPLFIIHNQISSPQPPAQSQPPQSQTQVPQVLPQTQVPQVLPQPMVQPVGLQQEAPSSSSSSSSSSSPKPPQVPAVQFQFATPAVSAPAGAGLKQQVPLPGLSAEQQHHLQLINAQLQTMASITQPSPQQKQLLEKLHQVQQNILLQAKQQAQTPAPPPVSPAPPQVSQAPPQVSQAPPASQFSKLGEPLAVQPLVSTAGPVPAAPALLQQKSVLVKPSAAGPSDAQVFSGAPGLSGVTVNQGITSPNLAQGVQAKAGLVSAVGGLALGKAGLQIQVLSSGLSQIPAAQAPAPVQTQTSALKRPFNMEPSKEARMLEQLRKLQGSVLHPDYSSPFSSFEDTLHRLLPYHLYQGMAPSPQDYRKVDDEFESVSNHLLKRTQAMLDKYRHLLFEESRRLGPSAEMVMIDRMFIQEEKMALNQDRILAKEKPEEFVASSALLRRPAAVERSSTATGPSATATGPSATATGPSAMPSAHGAPAPAPAPAPAVIPAVAPTPVTTAAPTHVPFPPTKLVIKQGGGGALVSWSTSSTPTPAAVVRPNAESTGQSSFGRASSSSRSADDDDDALPQRASKPPIKTYEARQRIGLKLKIKQEAGFSKVVHNTALDPVHSQSQHAPQSPEPPHKTRPAIHHTTTVIRTPPPTCNPTSSASFSAVAAHVGPAQSDTPSSTAPSASVSHSWSSSSSSSSSQMNGTLDHHDVGGVKRNPTSTTTPQSTTCRLPLRKTYRENVSPRHRPGVPGGGDVVPAPPVPSPGPHGSSPQTERTVIASVKLERQGGCGPTPPHADPGSQGLAEVEDEFYRGIKNAYHHHHHHHHHHHQPQQLQFSDKEDEDDGGGGVRAGRGTGLAGKNRERAVGMFCMDQHAPGPPSPGETSCTRDSSLPAKRCKSDSPDMDNASFSSGSPPPDDSLTEHLQCAIDSILNLQQGPAGRGSAHQHHPHHRQGPPPPSSSSSSSYRHSVSSSSPSSSSTPQCPQVRGRGQNGGLVSQTHGR